MDNRNSLYDVIPYRGSVVSNTSPYHLGLCSRWNCGVASPLGDFRLGELGCGGGANLLPYAFYHRESAFVGIDNCEGELARARQACKRLDLKNIRFLLKDVRDLDSADIPRSDYIIAHGIFSWVPPDARRAIIASCLHSLAPSGLAYVSYNAQPGWATRRLVRETLLRSRPIREAPFED